MVAETDGIPEYQQVLQQVAISYRQSGVPCPPPEQVTAALLQGEKVAKQQRLAFPFAGLSGQWQLCFTTGVRKRRGGGIALGKGFYLPSFIPAYIEFQPMSDLRENQGEISNQIQLGGLKLKLTGPTRYPGKKNLLGFDFTKIQVTLGRFCLYQGGFRGGSAKDQAFDQSSFAQLPFFVFFLVTEDYIAARGRGGGLALWLRHSTCRTPL